METTIRLATEHDTAALARIYRPIVAGTPISFETTPPDADEMAARLHSVARVAPWLVCDAGAADGVVGYAYASRHNERAAYRWAVNVSIFVDAGHHRQGIARALYTSLLALVRLQGFYVAHAGITLPNAASVGLHEALGFAPVGVYRDVGFKCAAWRDVGWWRLKLRDPSDEPVEPRSPAELAADPRFGDALASGLAQLRAG